MSPRRSDSRFSRAIGRIWHPSPALLVIPGLLVILLLFIWPLGQMVYFSFTDPTVGFENYVRFFTTPSEIHSLLTTMKVSFLSTILCAIIGYIYSYTMLRSSKTLANILMIAVVLPMGVSFLVRTFSLQAILRDTGIINQALLHLGWIQKPLPLIRNSFAVAVGIVSMELPFMVLPMYNSMVQINNKLLLAGESLGATPARVFIDIFFPLSLPGVLAGSLIVFVASLAYYVVPQLLGSGSELFLSQDIANWVQRQAEFGFGAAIGVILLLLTFGTLLVASLFINVDKALSQSAGGK